MTMTKSSPVKHMAEDEAAIREWVDTWGVAAEEGNFETMLSLLADDVVFLIVGAKPFGKKEFAERRGGMGDVRIQVKNDLEEVVVSGDFAYTRNHLKVTVTPAGAEPVAREGYTLSVFRREPSRRWVLARDANMLPPMGRD